MSTAATTHRIGRFAKNAWRGMAAASAVAGALLLALCAPQTARAAVTGTWTIDDNTDTATATAGDFTVTHEGPLATGQNYSNTAFATSSTWWTNPYSGTVSGGQGLTGLFNPLTTTTVTVSFSQPVNNPVLHVSRIGVEQGNRIKSARWTLNSSVQQSASVTLTKLSDNGKLEVTGSYFQRSDVDSTISGAVQNCTDASDSTGMGCGSIRFNGTGITQLSFAVTGVGNLNASNDGLELIWSLPDKPRLTLKKQVINDNGGTATAADFTLSATRGSTTISGKTNDPAITNASVLPGTYTLGETALAGYTAGTYACVLNGGAPVSGNSISLVHGDTAVCTIKNDDKAPTLALSKALGGTRVRTGDNFTVAIRTGGASGTIVSSTAKATTSGSGSTVTAGTGTTGDFNAVAGTTYTLTETGTSGTQLADYDAKLSCTDANALTPAGSLPTNEAFNPAQGRAITPVVGAKLRCTITNTPSARRVNGRVFLDNGAGSGTANDGIPNGGEGPLAGVGIRLTNCGSTVLARTVTDAAGRYSLAVPTGTATGAALCVEETNPFDRISTGASVSGTALPSGSAVSAGGSSYTYTRSGTPDRIAFQWNGTGHNALDFGDVATSRFAASGIKTGVPGNTVTYPHTFTAGTAGTVRFSIAGETATPAVGGWSARILADPGCTGTLQAGAAQLYPPAGPGTAVTANGNVCVIVQQFIPLGAPEGATNRVTVRADFDHANANPALAVSFTLDDLTTVSSVAMALKKEVRNLTQGTAFAITNQARPGETLEYRITYANNAETPVRSMTISDSTPSYTTFVSATAGTTPATLSNCMKTTPANPPPAAAVACATAQAAGMTGAIEWTFTGPLAPGATGSVLFQVKVN
ncbi:putative repeat protein (TIGR01451 family) [Variovorax sp. TBS-050B]|uniref:hypothetical protein n=1 Tax=Variovorax sp. TBS-050B TaxID=2940551 RepID=UPI002474D56D|nr:hypothetical protein [Variovorax sp. TBS-050B]MDH6593482.1 putative repeat protein (TIGR01451 family) [Variovorax sp. TBS-050B]